MNPDRDREEQIFDAARGIASAEERAAYLVQACGQDVVLLGRIEEMLKGGRIWGFTWSPDGQTLAVARDQNVVTLWNLTEVERALTRLGLDPHPTPERVSRMDPSVAGKQ